eukprot:Sspe_Gene.3918::Locus_1306_Transcript_1_1_Confidence_1.000_Length_1956::g.3918::m.3918
MKELDAMAVANEDAAKAEGRMVPRQVLRELERAMPADAMVTTDIGNSCSVSNTYLRFKYPPHLPGSPHLWELWVCLPCSHWCEGRPSPNRLLLRMLGMGRSG